MIAGRYSLDREIGRGGMGAVWLGRDEVLHRDVALKRIGMMPGASTPDLERAEREGRLAARLNHPHVVAIYDLVDEQDEQWLVMEYIEGSSLAQVIRADGPLSSERAAEILWQTADALAAAHTAGVVHRDVKPSNILLTTDGQAKLTDFGIARAEAEASLTQTGLVTGSPAYLSPEVASGQTATPAADVWSLGATLFHALAGRPPYDVGENVLGAMYRIVNEPPPRLDDAGWLAPLLENTMATDPEQRWSMSQVRDFLAGRGNTVERAPAAAVAQPTSTTPDAPAPPERESHTEMLTATPVEPVTAAPAARPRRRRSVMPWLAALLGLLLVIVIAYVASQLGGKEEDPNPPAADESTSSPADPSSEPDPDPTSESPPAQPDPAAMEAFVEDYLQTVTSDPKSAWTRLTGDFQSDSGGYGQYKGFWATIESATVRAIDADPAGMTVTYDVDYETTTGPKSDTVRLHLVESGDSFLIAAEG
ncbi:protein kinase domain-containing protein [Nocardioides sp. LHG3406-4]|uniref:serine/threonine-protein kinase n=1 Tax=Nocardioides sp. LHG3406-4 TaxID=2804575 RepID=UPI003CE8DFCE